MWSSRFKKMSSPSPAGEIYLFEARGVVDRARVARIARPRHGHAWPLHVHNVPPHRIQKFMGKVEAQTKAPLNTSTGTRKACLKPARSSLGRHPRRAVQHLSRRRPSANAEGGAGSRVWELHERVSRSVRPRFGHLFSKISSVRSKIKSVRSKIRSARPLLRSVRPK